jgi:hypothetical protein
MSKLSKSAGPDFSDVFSESHFISLNRGKFVAIAPSTESQVMRRPKQLFAECKGACRVLPYVLYRQMVFHEFRSHCVSEWPLTCGTNA